MPLNSFNFYGQTLSHTRYIASFEYDFTMTFGFDSWNLETAGAWAEVFGNGGGQGFFQSSFY